MTNERPVNVKIEWKSVGVGSTGAWDEGWKWKTATHKSMNIKHNRCESINYVNDGFELGKRTMTVQIDGHTSFL